MRTTTIESPLVQGFKKGLLGNFDTINPVDTSPPMSLPTLIRTTAEKFRVSARTVRRWHAAGVDIANDLEVAAHIAVRGRSTAALEAALELVKPSKP